MPSRDITEYFPLSFDVFRHGIGISAQNVYKQFVPPLHQGATLLRSRVGLTRGGSLMARPIRWNHAQAQPAPAFHAFPLLVVVPPTIATPERLKQKLPDREVLAARNSPAPPPCIFRGYSTGGGFGIWRSIQDARATKPARLQIHSRFHGANLLRRSGCRSPDRGRSPDTAASHPPASRCCPRGTSGCAPQPSRSASRPGSYCRASPAGRPR
jgi:hypothetical protein